MAQKKEQRKATAARQCSESMRKLLVNYKLMLEDSLREEGLTLAQLRLLKAIQERSDVSAAALARTCSVTPQTLQSVLARAEREGWILRGTSSRNRRFVTASLTEAGGGVLKRGWQMASAVEERIWRGVRTSDLTRLNEILGRGVANLEAEQQERKEALA